MRERPPASGDQPRRRNGYRRSRPFVVPLTILAELLGRSTTAPYKSVPRYGLRNWTLAVLRQDLTRGAEFIDELDLAMVVQLNATHLQARAQLVLARRAGHRATKLDPEALASVMGVEVEPAGATFLEVWLAVIDGVAAELVRAIAAGYVEDVTWRVAESYLDRVVWPRTKGLGRAGAVPGESPCRPQAPEAPVNLLGGAKRAQRILDALTSDDPELVAQGIRQWELQQRVLRGEPVAPMHWGELRMEI